MSITLKAKNF